jgi:hypothetical protein
MRRHVPSVFFVFLMLAIGSTAIASMRNEILLWFTPDFSQPTRYCIPAGVTWKIANGSLVKEQVHLATGWPTSPFGKHGFDYGLIRWVDAEVVRFGTPTQRAGHIYSSTAAVSLWLLFILCALLPLANWRRAYQIHRRKTKRLCLHCGYSLTGNTSGVCPELTM